MNTQEPTSLLAEIAASSVMVPVSTAPSIDGVAHHFEHFGDGGQPESDGPWHLHRISLEERNSLLVAAGRDARTTDAHPETVREQLEKALGDVADGVASPTLAWESAMQRVADVVRDYELRVLVSGLRLEGDQMTIGPVNIRAASWAGTIEEHVDQTESNDRPRRQLDRKSPHAVATVTLHGCPGWTYVVGMALIDAACDLPRAFAPFVDPIPDEIPGDAFPFSWLNPWFGIRIGERHVRREPATNDAVSLVDPTGEAIPPSGLWSWNGASGSDATVDPSIVVLPKDWPPPGEVARVAWDAASGLIGDPHMSDGAQRLTRALHWLARSNEAPDATDAQVFAVISIEALVAPTGAVEGRYARIAERAACLIERDKRKRKQARQQLLGHFDQRHALLHARDGFSAGWPEATQARGLAFNALLRFAELRLHRGDDSTANRWYGQESIAGV